MLIFGRVMTSCLVEVFLGVRVSKTRDAHDDMRQPEQCQKPRLVVLY